MRGITRRDRDHAGRITGLDALRNPAQSLGDATSGRFLRQGLEDRVC